MTNRNLWQSLCAAVLIFLSALNVSYADVTQTDLTTIEIRSDHAIIAPGDVFHIAIEITPDEGWHGYWENPGDAGLKLSVNWDLPEGIEIGDLQFTTPHLIPFEEIVTYGYEGEFTVIAEAKADENMIASDLRIGGDAFWLVCSDALCVPQEAKIGFNQEIGESKIDVRVDTIVKAAKDDMPEFAIWPSNFYTDGENFNVKTEIPVEYPVIESAYLFPHTEGMMENVYRQNVSFVDGNLIGRFKNAYGYADNADFKFLLKFKTGDGKELAYLLNAEKSETPILASNPQVAEQSREVTSELGLMMALTFAFLGGVILNLMPCVFPILSLKAMSVVELSSKDPAEARLSGLLYTAGVVVCFGLIGLTVNLLALGWGFHMQLPVINFALGLLMVVIGLNLLGVFEFSSAFSGVGGSLVNDSGGSRSSRRSTFFTGFLAVVVATPCTAPFMASALGYAFISGGIAGFIIFVALGLGLAFPYLLLCYVPPLRRFLPRPGAWMESMRNVLGFPMLATALWLFWILGNQIGVNAMTVAVAASLLLGVSLWTIKKRGAVWKAISVLSLIGILYSGYTLSSMKAEQTIVSANGSGLNAVAFNSIELGSLLEQEDAVFVYFTADWCVTCKLNERVALSVPKVHDAFLDKEITVMVGDWTNQNPDITETLRRYGRIGVPLYLYFPVGRELDNPVILPQILTPDIVIEAL